ncbi:MAG: hypothetical protein CBR30_08620 [Dictyoglomus sp. NZ13-RE01]|nr:MAG: hypothetical protein CBR30_08620 [Dictyoglomus sp. NZ13-RE01]
MKKYIIFFLIILLSFLYGQDSLDIKVEKLLNAMSLDEKIGQMTQVDRFQGNNLSDEDSVLSCPKHFLGDGGTKFSTGINGLLDQGDTRISEKELREIHLKPYIGVINVGARSIMVSFSSWNGIKMHANKYLLIDVLKKN